MKYLGVPYYDIEIESTWDTNRGLYVEICHYEECWVFYLPREQVTALRDHLTELLEVQE